MIAISVPSLAVIILAIIVGVVIIKVVKTRQGIGKPSTEKCNEDEDDTYNGSDAYNAANHDYDYLPAR